MRYFINSLNPNLSNTNRYEEAIGELLEYDIILHKYGDLLERWDIDGNNIHTMNDKAFRFEADLNGLHLICFSYLAQYPSQCGIVIIHDLKTIIYELDDDDDDYEDDYEDNIIIENKDSEKFRNLLVDLVVIHAMRCGFSQLRYTATDRQSSLIKVLTSKGWQTIPDIEFNNQRTGRQIHTLYKNLSYTELEDLGELIDA